MHSALLLCIHPFTQSHGPQTIPPVLSPPPAHTTDPISPDYSHFFRPPHPTPLLAISLYPTISPHLTPLHRIPFHPSSTQQSRTNVNTFDSTHTLTATPCDSLYPTSTLFIFSHIPLHPSELHPTVFHHTPSHLSTRHSPSHSTSPHPPHRTPFQPTSRHHTSPNHIAPH